MKNTLLFHQINSLPENLRLELEEFIAFLKSKALKQKKNKRPQFGSGKGTFKWQDDFDDPLTDFIDYQ